MSLFVVIPAVVGYLILASPLASIVSLGEMSTETATSLIAASLLALAVGILGETMLVHGSHGSYARSDAQGPLRSMILRAALTFVGIAIAARFDAGQSTLVALGLTVAFADLMSGGYLSARILRGAAGAAQLIRSNTRRSFAAAAVMAFPVYLVFLLGMDTHSPWFQVVGVVFTAAAVGFGIYVAIQAAFFKGPEVELYAAQVGSIFRRSEA